MLNSIISSPITLPALLICIGVSVVLGILTSLVFSYKKPFSSSLAITLALLPAAMCMVVMLVNGNLGVAVAVAGGFTIVRFRSIAGTGREISAIFVVMTLGVIAGMGYIGIAAIFFVAVAIVVFVLTAIHFGENSHEKLLKITIPENYDYAHLFEDVFKKYNIEAKPYKVKTTNMGSLIDVTYKIRIKEDILSKQCLDELRARNANLSIVLSDYEMERDCL